VSYQLKKIPSSVFRAYDIRGVIGGELDEDAYYSIGRAYSYRLIELERSEVLVGRDGRLTSPALTAALKQGLLDSGITVIDIGEVATPVLYYATHTYGVDSGLMVTGSHNPSEYNGIKMVLAGKTLVQKDIEMLHQLVQSGKSISGKGIEKKQNILPNYKNCIVSNIQLKRPLKVVVDCGNGIAGAFVPDVISALGCEVIPLYCNVDGHFPNHHPDPTIEANLLDLKKEVVKQNADLGLAFDGDADRLGVITDLGELIWPDRLMMLYTRSILQKSPGATIVFDVKCSSHLAEVIQSYGGIGKMCPTGHSIVKAVMKEEQAALAGEMSGHIFFKNRWYGFDDALYSGCRLLEILSETPKKVSEQFKQIPNSINTPELKIEISDALKFTFMQHFIKKAHFPEGTKIEIDGLRVEFPYGWGLIRASNTTPCLVARFEANDHDSLKKVQLLFRSQLELIDKNLKIPF